MKFFKLMIRSKKPSDDDDESQSSSSLYTTGIQSRAGGKSINTTCTNNSKSSLHTSISQQIRQIKRSNRKSMGAGAGNSICGDSTISGNHSTFYDSIAMPHHNMTVFEGGPLLQQLAAAMPVAAMPAAAMPPQTPPFPLGTVVITMNLVF